MPPTEGKEGGGTDLDNGMKEWLEVKEGKTASNTRRKLRKEQTFIHSPPESPKAEMPIFLLTHSYPEKFV